MQQIRIKYTQGERGVPNTYSSSRRGESQLLMHDEVFPKGNDEEDTEESSTCSQGDELADILRWVVGQKLEPVHCRDGAHE